MIPLSGTSANETNEHSWAGTLNRGDRSYIPFGFEAPLHYTAEMQAMPRSISMLSTVLRVSHFPTRLSMLVDYGTKTKEKVNNADLHGCVAERIRRLPAHPLF